MIAVVRGTHSQLGYNCVHVHLKHDHQKWLYRASVKSSTDALICVSKSPCGPGRNAEVFQHESGKWSVCTENVYKLLQFATSLLTSSHSIPPVPSVWQSGHSMVHKDMNNMAIAEYFQKDIHLHLFLLLRFTVKIFLPVEISTGKNLVKLNSKNFENVWKNREE